MSLAATRNIDMLRRVIRQLGYFKRNVAVTPHPLPVHYARFNILTKNALMRSEPRRFRTPQAPVNDDDDEDDVMRSVVNKIISERIEKRASQRHNLKMISPRVVYPYPTFEEHRTHWAAFRRRMVYGPVY